MTIDLGYNGYVVEMDPDSLNTYPASSLPGAQPTMLAKSNRPRYEKLVHGNVLIMWDELLPDWLSFSLTDVFNNSALFYKLFVFLASF